MWLSSPVAPGSGWSATGRICPALALLLALSAWAQTAAPTLPPRDSDDPRYRIRVRSELVVVPVTVKDGQGRLVPGLEAQDFRILEDGVEQKLSLFASEPFPLAAAILLDIGLDQAGARRLSEGLPALSGAFSESDEVALYTFDTMVERALDFTTDADSLLAALKKIREPASVGRAPAGGPLWAGPRINGRNISGMPEIRRSGPAADKRLDDAIFAAAQDLKRRDRARRKIILVISDGANSSHNEVRTEDALALLLHEGIAVYAIGVSGAWLPGAKTALRRYTSATGGDFFPSLGRRSVEQTYARVTEQARNQYTLAYVPQKPALSGDFRQIEVRVRRPGLALLAREGYYPAIPTP